MATRKPGTRFTDYRNRLAYSVEQTAKLKEINDDRYALDIAKREYVNYVLHANGDLDKDLDSVRSSIAKAATMHDATLDELKAKINKARRELTAAPKAKRAALRAVLTEQITAQTRANEAANAAQLLSDEFEEHLDQERFLFVLSDHGVPVIYYQCATPDNPDLPPLAGAAKKKAARKR